ncbi:uncharacterized protein LOC106133938 [Amyelois transitella]|uniref:uncharacterized protein LOC106133938 n=1 Tax=Amyelois transitella TaxID=680683 RepID=UPI00067BB582|nr:uncharacterized protein LOC106133938 [Amyelois transitella]
MLRLQVLITLFALATNSFVNSVPQGLCLSSFCLCLPAQHPSWINMNCSLPSDQILNIKDGDIPPATINLVITGARSVEFQANSLSGLQDVRKIHVKDCSAIVIKRSAAVELYLVRGLVDIENCDVLRIENNAFVQIKGPLSVNITNCDRASLEGPAFSWLLEMNISNVRQLDLAPEVFMRDLAANPGTKHGPDMKIELKNLTITKIPEQTFGHSAAKITMEDVHVDHISSKAFSGNTISNLTASDSSFRRIDPEAFSAKTQIGFLNIKGCKVHELASKALLSAVTNLNISNSRFDKIETGAINATVVSVAILDNKFHKFMTKGFELSSLNRLQIQSNSLDELPSHAIVAPGASIHDLIFADNEIETIHSGSLEFIGQASTYSKIIYKSNYYGQKCYCNMTQAFDQAIGVDNSDFYDSESFCTVDTFVARCFNVLDQNMLLRKFIDEMCNADAIQCEQLKSDTEIKNPRFPHKEFEEFQEYTQRNNKVIGIVIVTVFGCILIALFISFIKWMRRKGYCLTIKNVLISSNSSCGSFCDRICTCGTNNGLDNARSISQLSVHEYSERHRLNEPRLEHVIQETTMPTYEEPTPTEDKTTQTLPEELTKELLENLKNKLEDPENYVEAREMIEHLYELIKVEESCNTNSRTTKTEENIYELPFQNTQPRIGRNKKKMISIGTRVPSLDKLLPLSPYNRQTALAHEYFEPKDFAVHLYAEIANNEQKRTLLGAMPDVVGEQARPRGPYLRAVRDKLSSSSPSPASTPCSSSKTTPTISPIVSPSHMSIKSTKSNSSNASGKMLNRPLPQKPAIDPGEGPSNQHG